MSTIATVANVIGNLVGPLAQLIEGLIAAGNSPSDAEDIVRRDIESRSERIGRDRADRNDQFARKHGEPFDPGDR